MKLPFIHRSSYDWAIRQLEQRDSRVRELEQQSLDLTRHIVSLQLAGAQRLPDLNEPIGTVLTVDEQDALRAQELDDDDL